MGLRCWCRRGPTPLRWCLIRRRRLRRTSCREWRLASSMRRASSLGRQRRVSAGRGISLLGSDTTPTLLLLLLLVVTRECKLWLWVVLGLSLQELVVFSGGSRVWVQFIYFQWRYYAWFLQLIVGQCILASVPGKSEIISVTVSCFVIIQLTEKFILWKLCIIILFLLVKLLNELYYFLFTL